MINECSKWRTTIKTSLGNFAASLCSALRLCKVVGTFGCSANRIKARPLTFSLSKEKTLGQETEFQILLILSNGDQGWESTMHGITIYITHIYVHIQM